MWPKSNWEVEAKIEMKPVYCSWKSLQLLLMHFAADCCANAIRCEKDGTGMKFEPLNITWIGDHLCSRRSNTGRLQTKEMFVYSGNYFTAHLSSKMSRLNASWVIEEITVLRTSRPLIDRFLVPSSVICLPVPPLLMTSKLSPTFWLSRKLWQGKCQIMWSLLNFLTPSICFPTWIWQRSCVGLIGCLFSPGSG